MKICHFIDYMPPYHKRFGGGGQGIINLEQDKLDIITITSLFDKDFNKKDIPSNIYEVPTLEKYLGKIGNLLKLLIPFDIVSYYHIRRILKKERPNIAHIHNIDYISFSAIAAIKRMNLPVVYAIYDYFLLCPTTVLYWKDKDICKKFRGLNCFGCIIRKKGGFLRVLFLPITNFFFNFYIKKVNRFIVLSESSKGILIKAGISPSKIDIIRLPFKTPKIELKNIEKNSILYVGWIEPHKGLHVLIKAMGIVIKKVPDAKLYVIGSNDANLSYFNRIKELVENLNLSDNVHILGRLKQTEFTKRVHKSEIIAIPELWENVSPLFLMESMSLGKPIVATNTGGIPEFIENGKSGFLIERHNSQEFAQKLIELLKNKEKAKKFGKNIRRIFVQKFNNKKILKELITNYKKMMLK